MHCIRAPRQHHLSGEVHKMSLRVLYTRKGGFRTYESGWFHGVHDRLREWHWESPGWRRRGSLVRHTFPCLLQIPAQFLVGPAQLFVPWLRRSQINLDAFLIHSGRRHRLLKGAHRLHDLLNGDVFPSVWCDESLPRGRLHSDAQVNTEAKKQYVCVIVLISKIVYLVGFFYYPLYSLGFLLFQLLAFRVSRGMPLRRYYLILV